MVNFDENKLRLVPQPIKDTTTNLFSDIFPARNGDYVSILYATRDFCEMAIAEYDRKTKFKKRK